MTDATQPPNWLYIATIAPFTGAAGAASTYFVFSFAHELPQLLQGLGLLSFVINSLCLAFALMALAVVALFWSLFYRLPKLAQAAVCASCWLALGAFWWLIAVFAPDHVF